MQCQFPPSDTSPQVTLEVQKQKRGILLFPFLTSNETEKYQSKTLKIKPEIKLKQVDFLKKFAFP
jgi:hypothetical protein